MKSFSQSVAFVLLSILLTGCDKDKARLAFSHNLHVTENGMACTDCHGKMTAGQFAAAGHAACKECHGDWIDTKEIGAKTCGVCHKVKDLKALPKAEVAKAATNTVAEAGSVFRHSDALTNRCAECHGALLDKKLSQVPELTRAEKIRIRERAHRWGLSCIACHEDMNRTTPPPSHSQNWTRRHGTLGTEPDNACGMCHTKESCRECHQVTKPASHNDLWRLKTHGTQAAWDRRRCQVCHREDTCTACHADTRPQSHNAGWQQNHCLNCHPSQSTGTGCTMCHKVAIESHPNPHAAGWLNTHCDNCHLSATMAGPCSVCHKGITSASSHPNPHSAGWQDAHCGSCHAGSPEAQQCGVCHGFTTVSGHPNPHNVGWQDNHCFSCHPGSPTDQCSTCHAGGSSLQVHKGTWPSYHDRFAPGSSVSLCYRCHTP